jgi:hypothetical protein
MIPTATMAREDFPATARDLLSSTNTSRSVLVFQFLQTHHRAPGNASAASAIASQAQVTDVLFDASVVDILGPIQ